LIDRLAEVKVAINDKRFSELTRLCFEMCLVVKTLNDERVMHYAFKLFATVLSFTGQCKEAIELGYLMLDLALDMRELPLAMDSYFLLGNLLEQNKEYKTAMIAYRKMLQLAWFLNTTQHELLAYHGMAKQYFYLTELEHA
jgi:tetratricopeptide (TPR) repeat protein